MSNTIQLSNKYKRAVIACAEEILDDQSGADIAKQIAAATKLSEIVLLLENAGGDWSYILEILEDAFEVKNQYSNRMFSANEFAASVEDG